MGGAKQGKLGHPLMIDDVIICPATLKMPPQCISVVHWNQPVLLAFRYPN